MRIVLRGNPAYQVDHITPDEAAALRAWYGHSSSAEQNAIALAVIRHAKTMNGWIECDCTPGDFKPLLAPQQQERTLTLRRLTLADGDPHARIDRPNHADACPFHVDRDFEPSSHDRTFNLRPVRRETAYIAALPSIPTQLADPDRGTPQVRERNDRPSKLALVLWRLMDATGVNVLKSLQEQPSPYRLRDQLTAIHNAGTKWRVTRTWRFSALSTTWAGDYRDKNSKFQRLLRKSRGDWAPNQRRTGFMILFSTSVTDKLIRPAAMSESIMLHSRLRQPLRGDPRRRGPYLAIANVDFGDDDDDDADLRAVQSYAQPVFNGDTLFPVESGFERDVTDLLIWLQISLFEAAPRLRITIRKPLFAIPTPKGLSRPDFVLETSYGNHPPVCLVIEAMGMDTVQYLAAKAKMLPRMREIGPLYKITPADMSPANARALGADLQRWVLDHATSRRLHLVNG